VNAVMAGALFQGLALLSVDCVYHHTYSVPGANPGGGRLGQMPLLKPTKVTLFTMILYNTENNIRD